MRYEYRRWDENGREVRVEFDFPMGKAPAEYFDPYSRFRWTRVFGVAGVLFKGHGFHRTDYPNSKGRKYAT